MDLLTLKNNYIKEDLGIEDSFGRVVSFIDFSNVNNWFTNDTKNLEGEGLQEGESVEIDLEKLKQFSDIFSINTRFYYGHDPSRDSSLRFMFKTKYVFGKNKVFTKPIQKIKHYITDTELENNTRSLFEDNKGNSYVIIPKCNFDVEISVDALKLIEQYDTFCIWSGDADFVYLNNFLRNKKKKIIIVKGGNITDRLKKSADKVINAQNIKKHIAKIK